jgi:hypothetical protein
METKLSARGSYERTSLEHTAGVTKQAEQKHECL